jgi:enoyl-CoA hydratase/carnithine racemase
MAITLDKYQDKYENFRFERDADGVLLITMHTNGADLVWGMEPDDELGRAFTDVGSDPENQVIILTGTGDTFIHHEDLGADFDALPSETWGGYILPYVIRLIHNHLDIDAPMIAAINGPATIHAEMGLLCDIVLASDTAVFADQPHFPNGLVPGDGVQVIWPMLIGMNRARYLMYTGQVLNAQEALTLGLVNEVMPKDDLLPRARELAAVLLEAPELTRRLTRRAFGAVIKDQLNNVLPYGAALEGLAAAHYWPREFKGAQLPS